MTRRHKLEFCSSENSSCRTYSWVLRSRIPLSVPGTSPHALGVAVYTPGVPQLVYCVNILSGQLCWWELLQCAPGGAVWCPTCRGFGAAAAAVGAVPDCVDRTSLYSMQPQGPISNTISLCLHYKQPGGSSHYDNGGARSTSLSGKLARSVY